MSFYQQGQKPQPKKKEGCVIDVKKTKSGKRIKIGDGCKKEHIEVAKKDLES